ncbi:MAG: 3-oxo-tetronate kinase [Pseudomonadota bacterium]
MPLLGAIADDFTGATDLANTLARSGMRTVLVLERPSPDDPVPDAEAVVVALKSRTAPVAEAVGDSVASWQWLAGAGAEQCYFKYCSTFDSTPQGNIGPVSEALMAQTGAPFTVYCPAFPEAGRTIYMGKLFVMSDLLHETGMKDHPLTPMTDADLRRWLSPQIGDADVGLVPYNIVERGPEAVRQGIELLAQSGIRHSIVDALCDDHLRILGRACAGMPLVTAGSGLGLGLAENFAEAGRLAGGAADRLPSVGGASLMLSGSCSEATNAQVAAWEASGGALLRLDPLALADGKQDSAEAWAWAWAESQLRSGPALIAATAPPESVRAAQEALGVARAAELVEETLSSIAALAHRDGVRRFIIAGGETSGAVATALGVHRLAVGPQIAPGVPWCATLGEDPTALTLKSGNFGSETFFADAVERAP